MQIFIDDVYIVRIEYEGYIHHVSILAMDKPLSWKATEGAVQWFYSDTPIPLQLADKINVNGHVYPLQIGLVTLTDVFEQTFRYDGPLGAVWTQDYTDFYVYSPVAKEIKLILDQHMYTMTTDGMVYHVRVKGDWSFKPYYYEVRLVNTFEKVYDPYVKMTACPSGVVVPDNILAKPTPIQLKDVNDAIIYESHVRDMSIHLDVEHPGLFLGMTERHDVLQGSVVDYIKDLGMTHIQLLPVFDFEGVDPIFKSSFYNWGYNPKHYFALQPWFSSQPSNPEVTMKEFIHLVDDIHNHGLGVIMDVVYNHVYDVTTYPYDKLVPGYFYRHDEHYQMTNGSFCGNEVETRRFMVRRLIIDSLSHFVRTYQIDGFRFDLMGLMDVETMNQIREALMNINPYITLYGEGWHMNSMLGERDKASQQNYNLMPHIAHFNDTFRNDIKGDNHGPALGFGTGGDIEFNTFKQLLLGSPHRFSDPAYSINYVECHDNSTLFDKLNEDLPQKADIKTYQKFTNAIVSLAKGMTFYHAGQEMFRFKQGVENSYQSPDYINGLVYDLGPHIDIFKSFITYQKETQHLEMDIQPFEAGLMIYKNQDIIFVKTTQHPYTYQEKSSILITSTSDVIKTDDGYQMPQVGVYIFRN